MWTFIWTEGGMRSGRGSCENRPWVCGGTPATGSGHCSCTTCKIYNNLWQNVNIWSYISSFMPLGLALKHWIAVPCSVRQVEHVRRVAGSARMWCSQSLPNPINWTNSGGDRPKTGCGNKRRAFWMLADRNACSLSDAAVDKTEQSREHLWAGEELHKVNIEASKRVFAGQICVADNYSELEFYETWSPAEPKMSIQLFTH